MAGLGQAVFDLLRNLNELPSTLPVRNPGFLPDPRTRPITLLEAATPPVLYYLALVLLFPSPSSHWLSVRAVRLALALASAYTFLALPYRFHVPASAIFTYQLGLVGWYGGPRVLDLLVISKDVPKRVRHVDGEALSQPATTSWTERPRLSRSSSLADGAAAQQQQPAKPHPSLAEGVDHSSGVRASKPEAEPLEQTLGARLLWALDLMTSMRGVGWDWCSADVRHSTRSWHPPPADRVNALVLYILPSLVGGLSVMKHIFNAILDLADEHHVTVASAVGHSLLWLPLHLRFLGVASCGITLYCLFDASYTIAAILLGLASRHAMRDLTQASSIANVASMPPLNPLPATSATSVRAFWSRAWHRLFARLFLIWGARPGQRLQQWLAGLVGRSTRGDVGKVIGAFAVSAVVHGQGERAALGARAGDLYSHPGLLLPLGGEPLFFMLSALAVLLESAACALVLAHRRRRGAPLEAWSDKPIGAVWTVGWLLFTGQSFVEGWVKSGIVAELTLSGLEYRF